MLVQAARLAVAPGQALVLVRSGRYALCRRMQTIDVAPGSGSPAPRSDQVIGRVIGATSASPGIPDPPDADQVRLLLPRASFGDSSETMDDRSSPASSMKPPTR